MVCKRLDMVCKRLDMVCKWLGMIADQQVTKDMHSPWAAVFYVNAAV